MSESLVNIYKKVKVAKFRVRNVATLTDFLILGIHSFEHCTKDVPKYLRAVNMFTYSYEQLSGYVEIYCLLSSTSEMQSMKILSEREVDTLVKDSYFRKSKIRG